VFASAGEEGRVLNCTVVGNTTAGLGGGIHSDGGVVTNTIDVGAYEVFLIPKGTTIMIR
jgi:predicted outer membrane repeat protein